MIRAAGGQPRRLTSDTREGGASVWTPDGRYILFSSARRGSRTLWRVSGDGSRIYFLRPAGSRETRELWSIARDGRDEKKIGVLGSFFVIDVHVDVSPRDQIVWTQFREGRHELWLAEMR